MITINIVCGEFDAITVLLPQADVHYTAAYGSGKDVHIYRELGLQANSIFIVGKASKRHGAQAQV